jgi:hypothetical protein
MKTIHRFLLTSCLLLAAGVASQAGPVGKGGFVIAKPGKYTLIRNINVGPSPGLSDLTGVVIKASNVELDLAGYTIGPAVGKDGMGIGILIKEGVSNIRISNGRVRGVDFGIFANSGGGPAVAAGIFERLQVNDCTSAGISIVADACVIRNCTVAGAGNFGIQVLTSAGGFNEVSDCTVHGPGSAGITATNLDGLTVRSCSVSGCTTGIAATAGCKLFDNLTLSCTTAISGNPQLVGVNN